MLQRIFEKPNILPGPSSQTTSSWPLVLKERDEQITGHSIGYTAGNPTIRPPKERTWDETMEKVMLEYAEAWKRLAAL